MIYLLVDEPYEVVAFSNVVICIYLDFLAAVRFATRYRMIINKSEYISFVFLFISIAIWSASFLAADKADIVLRYTGLLLFIVFFSIYLLSIARDVIPHISPSPYITGSILFSLAGLFIILLPPSLIPPCHQEIIFNTCIIIALLLNLKLVYQLIATSSDNYYQTLRIVLAVLIIMLVYDMIITCIPLLGVNCISIWAALFFILLVGFKALDREYMNTTRALTRQIAAVQEEYNAEAENIEDVVISLARTIDAKDKYTEGHTERVSQLAVFLGERMGLEDKQLENLRIGALIHDIGKIGINLNILNKQGALTPEEKEQIQKHPELGEQICSPLKVLANVRDIIRHHHEKLDGSGYPDGLKEDEISLEVRIVTIADIFDALTTERSYRKALSIEDAMNIIYEEALMGKLDIDIVRQFEDMLREIGVLL